MDSNDEYYDYNALDYEKGNKLIDIYYDNFLNNIDENQLCKKIGKYINLVGDYDEYMKCYFAHEFRKDEYEHFADSGVLYSFEYPQVFGFEDYMNNGYVNVILTNEEFYSYFSKRCIDYCNSHSNISKTRIEGLLMHLKGSLKNNKAVEFELKR